MPTQNERSYPPRLTKEILDLLQTINRSRDELARNEGVEHADAMRQFREQHGL